MKDNETQKKYNLVTALKAELQKREMTLSEIQNFIGRGIRTAYRYIDLLGSENCGLKQLKKNKSTYFTIQTQATNNFNQNIIKTLEQVIAKIKPNTLSNLEKIQMLKDVVKSHRVIDPDILSKDAIATDRSLILDYGPFGDFEYKENILKRILDAVHKKLKIIINYTSVGDDSVEKLEVSPVKVIMRIDTLYLIAADENFPQTGIFKNFILQNIKNVRPTIEHIDPSIVFDEKIHYRYTFGKYTQAELKPQKITLRIRPTSTWIKTQFEKSHFNPPLIFKKDKAHNDLIEMNIRMTPDFKTWLLGILPHVQIVEPKELREELKDILKKTLADM